MRRGFWFLAGMGTGVYAVFRVRRAAEAFTPDGMRDRLAGLSLGARLLGQDVSAAMAEAEIDLRQRLGLGPDGVPELSGPQPAAVAAHDPDTSASRKDDL